MTLKDKLMIYVYRKGNQIEQEEKDLKTSLRLSALDNLDHYEILRHRIRLQAWNNFIYEPIFNISPIILNIQKSTNSATRMRVGSFFCPQRRLYG